MTLNPPLNHDFSPAPVAGELFVMHRDNVDFEASLIGDDGQICMKLFKNGKLYVTTIRMVFVASNPDVNSDFCSFDIPLSNVRGEQFNQPIFGCNNLSGMCLPLPGFSGSINWVIAFKSGGVGRLLSVLQDLLVRNRTGRPEAPEGINQEFEMRVMNGGMSEVGFVDPHDPTVIYASQPANTFSERVISHTNRAAYFAERRNIRTAASSSLTVCVIS